jgi:membrane associated rhomboid family serine protease
MAVTTETRTDAQIQSNVLAELKWDARVLPNKIGVAVKNAVVILTGWVGDNVEDRMGPVRFVIFYIPCRLAAGVVHWFVNADSTIPAVGASGAIAGVVDAYFVLFPHAHVIVMFPVLFFPVFFALSAVTYLGFWALSQVFSGTLFLAQPGDVGGVAWWAHAGGFAAGISASVSPQHWRVS